MTDAVFTARMVKTVFTVAATVIVFTALWAAREALMLIYVSALIAMGFSPLVGMLEQPRDRRGRARIPRVLAILAVYLAVIGVVVVIGLLIVPPLIEQAAALWNNLPRYFDRFQRLLIRYKLTTHTITIQEAVQNAPAGASGNAVGTVLGALWGVLGGILGVISILILSFYLLVEAQPLFQYLVRFVPAARRPAVAQASREAVTKVSAWLRAQLILAGVMGTFAAVGLALLGEPYFYVVALIAAVGETIPVIGPIIGGISAVAVALSVSTRLALTVGIYFLVLHQLEANILVPKIMERRVGVSPVTVMVALLIGGALTGVSGAILAIPTAAILSVIVDELAAKEPPA
ncbi:MAG TPA: AI-2E family transporter [Vicinamibacterales bacterium]|jgi:predicted PurR-regulated permease PerM|nr:AI-2E family transporter [Vicinamibacterales bacterium]